MYLIFFRWITLNCNRNASTPRVLHSGRQLPSNFPGQQQMWRRRCRMLQAFEFPAGRKSRMGKVVREEGGSCVLLLVVHSQHHYFVHLLDFRAFHPLLLFARVPLSFVGLFCAICGWGFPLPLSISPPPFPSSPLLSCILGKEWAQFMPSVPLGAPRQGKPSQPNPIDGKNN